MTTTARLRSIGTAVPAHRLPQSEAKAFAAGFFASQDPRLERLLPAFDNTGIDERQLARPASWYGEPHSFEEKNACYREVAADLGHRAARRALAGGGLDASEVGAIVFVSTTGLSTPSLDVQLVARLGLRRDVVRLPVWGLGCAGGVAGLARAADLARALGQPVLLVASEVCSTTFVHGDRSKSNMIATALFGDGAAAALVVPGSGPGPEIVASTSELLPDTEDVMGWSLGPEGLEVRFARSIPSIVRELAPRVTRTLAHRAGWEPGDLRHFVVHPGGAKVLLAYRHALGLDDDDLRHAWSVLREHGNMSSATVLFVFERFLVDTAATHAPGVVLGLGPGFAAEAVAMRW